ncbi:MAG: NarK/NasA family nitrate transporter [Bacteroidetes bacterium]|nr:NarK/NasA family nitrate transporter [Bacteroidota bacterium]
MEQKVTGLSYRILFLNTLAFTVCFAVWMFNGVLVTFLVDNQIFKWSSVQVGWLLAIPVLSGSIFRLHGGIWTDKYGGKWMLGGLLFLCAIPMFLVSQANSFVSFALCSLGFGLAGVGFSIGIASTSMWFSKEWQGRALGIFGMGNFGAGITTLLAPTILKKITNNGANLDNWRQLPQIYALALVIMGVIFIIFTKNKKSEFALNKKFTEMLKPLKEVRVWRFGLYYYLVFGCFVALAQWLVPYYMNVYSVSLVTAGLLATIFSIPSGLIRALGGFLSDKFGARRVMYWIFITSIFFCFLLIIPKMTINSPGIGIQSKRNGTISFVSDSLIKVDDISYTLIKKPSEKQINGKENSALPHKTEWQESIVKVGDKVKKKQIIARGTTNIVFKANIYVATLFIFLVGIIWGIGKAAVYKHIPNYFPNEVGAVGGMVGVLGGLGGFFSPIIFGYLLKWTGLWTSMWIFLWIISVICLWWMHNIITKMRDKAAPDTKGKFESIN